MISLDAINKVAQGLLPQVLDYAERHPQDMLDLACSLGPIGGCNETFSPLYMFDICRASCSYCGFAKGSVPMPKVLTVDEALRESMAIKAMGCDAAYVLGGSLTAWDSLPTNMLSTQAVYAARGIRAVVEAGLFPVLEMSPFSRYEFEQLAGIVVRGRYVLFQETYNSDLYRQIHQGALTMRYKGTPEERITQVSTALSAGWREVGIGAILGLAPDLWSDVAAVIAHAQLLLGFGARLVTISVPRLNLAAGAVTDARCSDDEFIRAVAIYSILCRSASPGRVKVVITGRETAAMRDLLAPLTDIWGIRGSTTPGGYAVRPNAEGGQFSLAGGDRRLPFGIPSSFAARHHV